MSAFVISQKDNLQYKFTFEHRRGRTLITSNEYLTKEETKASITFLKNNFTAVSFANFKTPSGKFYFKLLLDDKVFATSRKYTTELRQEKTKEEILKTFEEAEVLDFSENIFSDLP